MMIIGCDFHPSWEQVSWLDTETGERGERKLVHATGEAQEFYRAVPAPALIGLEATGNCHWLQDLLVALGHEVWIGAQRLPLCRRLLYTLPAWLTPRGTSTTPPAI